MPSHSNRESRSGRPSASEARSFGYYSCVSARPESGTLRRAATGAVTVLTACVAFFLLLACNGNKKSPDASSSPSAIEKTFERGPVKAVVRLDNPTPSIADRITLELVVTCSEDYEIELPAFGERLEQFGIVDFLSTQPELVENGRVRQSRTYVLEPFLSGDYVIPSMTIRFQKRDSGEGEGHELTTEELKVQVSSLLPEDAERLEIHDISPPVELPKPRLDWLWPTAGGLAAVALTAVLIAALARRKTAATVIPRRPAHEIAFAALEELVGEDLPGTGRIKEFYQRISDILRQYIENRFGLHAPDRTTEEFLSELGRGEGLTRNHQPLLEKFLHHCDLVKFAEHQPDHDDIQNTFDACKNFIIATQEPTSPQAPPPESP